MSKIIVVAGREYASAVKSKAFIVTIVAMPILMGVGLFAEMIAEKGKNISDRKIVILDRTGQIYEGLAAEADRRNKHDIFEDSEDEGEPRQIQSRFILEQVDSSGQPADELAFQLSERIRKGEVFAFVDIGAQVTNADRISAETSPEAATIQYYTSATTNRALQRWLGQAVTQTVQQHRIREAGFDPEQIHFMTGSPRIIQLGLVERNATTGQIEEVKEVDRKAALLIPLITIMLMFGVIMIGASPLIQSTLEEKTQRIAEVLLASLTPFQWMMGKLIGMVGVSLTIVTVYFAGGAFIAVKTDVWQHVPVHLIGWFALFQVLAVLMFGALFIAVGSACSDHREAQSAVMPVMILIILPMMMLGQAIQEPNGTLATWLSFFPPATPMLMLTRQSIPPGIPMWQPLVGAALTILATTVCIWAAGRIFRVGILAQGKGAGLKDMAKWLISG